MTRVEKLTALSAGMKLLVGGDRVLTVTAELAAAFREGDVLRVVPDTGELLHIARDVQALVSSTVNEAHTAFGEMAGVTDAQISSFFEEFAARLERNDLWAEIARTNESDVEQARRRGRSTTRLVASETMRAAMIGGLRGWVKAPSMRGRLIERVEHEGWHVDLLGAELGVVGFVFEGRPNVVADATGVLRGGNTVVFRIGRDALATARSIIALAVAPALEQAGMPRAAVSLIDSPEHAAGWALFSERRLSLAVARGSGPAVATLGRLAQQAGIPVSLHGTGGAWIIADDSADPDALEQAVYASLDRKVCNTLNTACLPISQAERLLPALLRGLERAGTRRGQSFKLHVVRAHQGRVAAELFERDVQVQLAEGARPEKQAELLDESDLGVEWEWEETPEISLTFTQDTEQAIRLFNRYSPQFVASLVSQNRAAQEHFYQRINAPFVGDGFTRWVDGQFALNRPELGLSNWQHGRLFGRGGVLSGDSVFTVRTRRMTSAR